MSESKKTPSRKKSMYVIIAVLVVASIALRLLTDFHLEQYSLLFIGLPALIAILVVRYADTPKSAYGVVFRTITIFLLLSSILFGEGLICILMAAPLFYGVGALVVYAKEYTKKKGKENIYSIAIVPIIILLAQPLAHYTKSDIQEVQSVHQLSEQTSLKTFDQTIIDLNVLPNSLRIGFPVPLDIKSTGADKGDEIRIRFKSSTKGVGTLHFAVKERSDKHIVFTVKSDNTHIKHWLSWESIRVDLTEDKKAIWTSRYTCDLHPAWYFKTAEKVVVEQMNQYLLNLYFN